MRREKRVGRKVRVDRKGRMGSKERMGKEGRLKLGKGEIFVKDVGQWEWGTET